ncbi:MAG: DUF1269 domain-containing protein [Nitrosospira sp.]
MNKFIVVIFPSESQAYEGAKGIRGLQDEGNVFVYGMTILTRGSDGKLATRDTPDESLRGTAVGAFIGGVLGLAAGPIGLVYGAATGAVLGSWADLLDHGISAEFIDEVSQTVTPGKTAVVTDIEEFWTAPLDARMEPLGGIVLRQWRRDVETDRIESEISTRTEQLADLKAEHAQARDETKSRLQIRIDNEESKLKIAADRAKKKIEALKLQAEARIKLLQDQAAKASMETKVKIDQRIAKIHAESEKLSARLHQAWERTRDMLKP